MIVRIIIKYIAAFSIVIGIATSCALEETFEPSDIPEVTQEYPGYFILSGGSYRTKVTYSGDAMSSYFQDGELLGAFALDQNMVPLTGRPINACYKVVVTEETHLETGEKIRILEPDSENDDLRKDGEGIPAYYMFYYPYDSSVQSLDDLKQYEHSVAINQNSREAFQTSDLLWDITSPAQDITGTAEYVWVEMDHAMAQIIVEIESDLIQEGTVPTLLSMPITVSPINLVKSSLEEMTADMGKSDSYILGEETDDINMWGFGYATSGNLMFRAVVPANHSIKYGSAAIEITSADGTLKRYRILKPLDFHPGMTYRMTLVSSRDVVTPDDVGDEDTWVYDVLDPETMEPVGLLCREYIHFQPGKEPFKKDISTGNEYNNGATKYISSQAWVFYRLKESGVPDLDTGYVLRFILDVHSGTQGQADGMWPYPYEGYPKGGLFTPDHGHTWSTNVPDSGLWDANGVWGVSSEDHTEFYMHGGTIDWDGVNNKIEWFTLPEKKITNKEAKEYGHIAIPDNNEPPFLCYNPIDNDSPHKIGIFSPHNLVDRRIGKEQSVEERIYPLVKIGYNQFWMSLSLRASTMIDGTELINYNSPKVKKANLPSNADDIQPGYMYSNFELEQTETLDGKEYDWYDPYYDYTPQERESYKISVMYNHLTLFGAGMLPTPTYSTAYYNIPNADDIISMLGYLDWYFGAKIMTRGLRSRKLANNSQWLETQYEALRSGKYLTKNMDQYAANICGFDLRAEGLCNSGELKEIGDDARLLILGSEQGNEDEYIFGFPDYLVWDNKSTDALKGNTDIFVNVYEQANNVYKYFAPIRFFLKFKGQKDNTGNVSVTSLARNLKTKASTEDVQKLDVYIGLEPVEE